MATAPPTVAAPDFALRDPVSGDTFVTVGADRKMGRVAFDDVTEPAQLALTYMGLLSVTNSARIHTTLLKGQ